jgi:formylglycine-generating enzyme required for sulfatase activity
MSEPVRVFVSYASPDRAFAERLVNDLKRAGAEVWWDVSGIDEGDFLDRINDALQQCAWLVLVLTPNAIQSKWVKLEVNAAIHLRQQGFMDGVLPVLAAPTEPRAIPPLWANLHRYDGVMNYQGEVARLMRKFGLSSQQSEQQVKQPLRSNEEGVAAHLPGQPSASTPTGSAGSLGPEKIGIASHLPSYLPSQAPARPQPAPMLPVQLPQRLRDLGFALAQNKNGVEYIMPPTCQVPAGAFLMGSDPKKDTDVPKNEQPQHTVTLATYEIGKFPVTVAEYACFLRTGQHEPQYWQQQLGTLDHPVGGMNWKDAAAYAKWLADLTGQPWWLPSEAKWEKAARGTDGRIYPWGDAFDSNCANTMEGGKIKTPVGSYPRGASPCGALDMAGNVWEWTCSTYRPYNAPFWGKDEYAPRDLERDWGYFRCVQRGGSWLNTAWFVRAAYRYHTEINVDNLNNGFRLARSAR